MQSISSSYALCLSTSDKLPQITCRMFWALKDQGASGYWDTEYVLASKSTHVVKACVL